MAAANSSGTDVMPIIPVRNKALLPYTALRLTLGRQESVRLVKDELALSGSASSGDMRIGVTCLDTSVSPERLHKHGCVARVVRIAQSAGADGKAEQFVVWVEGVHRLTVRSYVQKKPYVKARVMMHAQEELGTTKEEQAMGLSVRAIAKKLLSVMKQAGTALPLVHHTLEHIDDINPWSLAYTMIGATQVTVQAKNAILATEPAPRRLQAMLEVLTNQLELLKVSSSIQSKVKAKFTDNHRKYFLKKQLEEIKKELGEEDSPETAAQELRARLESIDLPATVRQAVERELMRLDRMPQASPEHSMVTTYLEWIADIPWKQYSKSGVSAMAARKQLDLDHFGLQKVKKRIIEWLSVLQLNPDAPAPILCLVGPPGVGKTSLGRSIATAVGREFHRLALGGVRDVTEIRGHRRTYVGAMPGSIIRMMKQAEFSDPVVLLDEIDKVGQDARGDPSAALLEVLDPEQNNSFMDHYLGVPYDLSKIMFIATANRADTIPGPLLDRMEVITLTGYTQQEKTAIASKYLWPKQLKRHGLGGVAADLDMTTQLLHHIIQGYTREAGVRALEQCLASICRTVAAEVVASQEAATTAAAAEEAEAEAQEEEEKEAAVVARADDCEQAAADTARDSDMTSIGSAAATAGGGDDRSHDQAVTIDNDDLATPVMLTVPVSLSLQTIHDSLGPPKFFDDPIAAGSVPGVVSGLAWTPAGGDVLTIEVVTMPGTGSLRLTGQLGDVMQESIHTAMSWIQSHGAELGIDGGFARQKTDVHVHFPAGAIPKDGPSAGVAITVALVSAFTRRCARRDTAMTGEVTLRGAVLPVGGVKEKVLAAHRMGVKRVLLPLANQKDVHEIPQEVLASIELQFVTQVSDAIASALEPTLQLAPAPAQQPVHDVEAITNGAANSMTVNTTSRSRATSASSGVTDRGAPRTKPTSAVQSGAGAGAGAGTAHANSQAGSGKDTAHTHIVLASFL